MHPKNHTLTGTQLLQILEIRNKNKSKVLVPLQDLVLVYFFLDCLHT